MVWDLLNLVSSLMYYVVEISILIILIIEIKEYL